MNESAAIRNPNSPVHDNIAVAMRALGHPVRLSILSILTEKCDPQCCCNDITSSLPLAQSTVSQHIKVLLQAGLIDRHAKGTRNCYTVNLERLNALQASYADYLNLLENNLACGCEGAQPES